jgi:hypothetical protein
MSEKGEEKWKDKCSPVNLTPEGVTYSLHKGNTRAGLTQERQPPP